MMESMRSLAAESPAAPALAPGVSQSVLQARGDNASQILDITWVLLLGGGLIFVAVMAVLLLALHGPPRVRAILARNGWIVGAGIAFPVVVLSALLAYTLVAAAAMARAQQGAATVRIQVAGELWWWRVKYLDATGATLVETANEIRIPAGQPVDFELVSDNVIHSFWVPSLAGKVDMIPGRTNRLRLRAHAPGVFRGQCAEYCGAQHALMAFHVVAMAPDDYAAWLAARQRPAAAPQAPLPLQGLALFAQNRCGLCHTVRGTSASGALGPDLTHVGSRLSLAAGTLPNGAGSLAAWIMGTQQIKPGSVMPAYHQFAAGELQALTAYLQSLQ